MNRKRSRNIIHSIIILAVCFFAFLTGCGGSSSKNPTIVYYNGDSSSSPSPLYKDLTISQDGRVARTTSPSGMLVIEAPEQNTYSSEVVLKITESPSVGNESSLLTIGSKIYGITATRDGQPINYLSHPLNLTFSNEEKLNGAQNYYIGIKEIGDNAWQFVNVYSTNASIRTSISSTSEFKYSLYKNNILIALFSDAHKVLQNTPKVLELTATLTPSIIETNNSLYTKNLRVNMHLKGENLSNLTADNFKIKIAYLTSSSQSNSVKVDDRTVNYLTSSTSNQYEAFGEGYAHYFEFTPLSNKFSSGFAPSISFDINLKDFPASDFSNSFIVEISNADPKILPFAYSTFLHFDAKNSESNTDTDTNTETETNTNISTDTNTSTDTSSSTGFSTDTGAETEITEKAAISLKSPRVDFPVTGSKLMLEFSKDIVWNSSEQSKITIDNNAVINEWSYSDRVLSLSFKDKLAYYTTYMIKVANMTGVQDATLVFKTEGIGTVSLKSATTDFQISNSSIVLEFSKDISWTMADRAKISIDNSAEITEYTYADQILTLALKKKLKFETTYLIKVIGLEGIENNTIAFKTENNADAVLRSDKENFSVKSPIEVEFSKDILFDNEDLANLALNNDAVISGFSYANNILTLNVEGKLNYDTLYGLTFNAVNGVAAGKALRFKTEKINARPVIRLSEESIKANMNGRTALQPTFYIDFGKPIASPSLALSKISLNGIALPEGCTLEFEADKQNAVLKITSDLEEAVDYKLSIKAYTDEDNGNISAVDFDFRTMPSDNLPGSGTIDDPYLVYHQGHLSQLNNTTPINYLQGSFFFKQMDDITLDGIWTPIGDEGPNRFIGNYDGNNKTISNLKIRHAQYAHGAALFSSLYNGSFSNLTIRNADIVGKYDEIAPLVGYIEDSVIENVKIEGDINLSFDGYSNCYMGGLVGKAYNRSKIRKCTVTGNLKICENDPKIGSYYGGLVGSFSGEGGEISDCCVDSPEGIIRADYNVGGLVGVSYVVKITNSYAKIVIKAYDCYIGGLIGCTQGTTIENCYSDCQIYAYSDDNRICECGGLIGYAREDYYGGKSNISNCYASGTINIKTSDSYKYSSYIAALIGIIDEDDATISNSFSTVKISVDDSYVYNDSYTSNFNPALGTPLLCKYNSGISEWEYIYDSDGTNYYGRGYDPSILNWNTAYWFNLSDGSFPKLNGLPNR